MTTGRINQVTTVQLAGRRRRGRRTPPPRTPEPLSSRRSDGGAQRSRGRDLGRDPSAPCKSSHTSSRVAAGTSPTGRTHERRRPTGGRPGSTELVQRQSPARATMQPRRVTGGRQPRQVSRSGQDGEEACPPLVN